GQNVAIEFRWAAGQDDRLPDLAADLIRRRVAAVSPPASTPALPSGKTRTPTTSVILSGASAPASNGFLPILHKPGGKATGVSLQTAELVPKQLEMLRELAPGANRFVALVNPNSAFTDAVVKDLQASASALGLPIEILRAGTGREIDAAFANLVQKPGGALLVGPDAFFF